MLFSLLTVIRGNSMHLPVSGGHQEKDKFKAFVSNKFLGFGSPGSSTQKYADYLPKELVNTGRYAKEDYVFISMMLINYLIYLAAALPAFLRTNSPTKRIPFPL